MPHAMFNEATLVDRLSSFSLAYTQCRLFTNNKTPNQSDDYEDYTFWSANGGITILPVWSSSAYMSGGKALRKTNTMTWEATSGITDNPVTIYGYAFYYLLGATLHFYAAERFSSSIYLDTPGQTIDFHLTFTLDSLYKAVDIN